MFSVIPNFLFPLFPFLILFIMFPWKECLLISHFHWLLRVKIVYYSLILPFYSILLLLLLKATVSLSVEAKPHAMQCNARRGQSLAANHANTLSRPPVTVKASLLDQWPGRD